MRDSPDAAILTLMLCGLKTLQPVSICLCLIPNPPARQYLVSFRLVRDRWTRGCSNVAGPLCSGSRHKLLAADRTPAPPLRVTSGSRSAAISLLVTLHCCAGGLSCHRKLLQMDMLAQQGHMAAGPQTQLQGNMTDINASDPTTDNSTSSSINTDTMGGSRPDNSDMEGDGMDGEFGPDDGPGDSQDGAGGSHNGPGGPHDGGPHGGPHEGPHGGPHGHSQDGPGQHLVYAATCV